MNSPTRCAGAAQACDSQRHTAVVCDARTEPLTATTRGRQAAMEVEARAPTLFQLHRMSTMESMRGSSSSSAPGIVAMPNARASMHNSPDGPSISMHSLNV